MRRILAEMVAQLRIPKQAARPLRHAAVVRRWRACSPCRPPPRTPRQAVPPPAPVTATPLRPFGSPAAAAPVAATAPSVAARRTAAPPRHRPATFTPAPAAPQTWLPRGTAEVQALDKVNARNATLTVKVGDSRRHSAR